MNIMITLVVPDEYADADHPTGMTEEGFDRLSEDLMGWEIVSGPDQVGA